jgi:hypothetical protein
MSVGFNNGVLQVNLTGQIAGAGSGTNSTASALTQHDVLVASTSNNITSVAPSATSGVALVSQGASADPAFGTVVVAGGGTGATSLTGVLTGNGTSAITASTVTQHGVLLGGASNAVSSLGVAATGTVLTGSTGADPAFSDTPSVTSITLSSGTALNNYTEGTWTPTAIGASTAGTTTYSTQQGYYTQLGSLPFTVKNQSNYVPTGSIVYVNGNTWAGSGTMLTVFGVSNTTTLNVYCSASGAGGGTLAIANASTTMDFTISYQV